MLSQLIGKRSFDKAWTAVSLGTSEREKVLVENVPVIVERCTDLDGIMITVAPTPRHGIDLSFRITVDEDGPAEVVVLEGRKSTLAPFEQHGPDLLASMLGNRAGRFAGLLQPVLSSGIYQLTDVIGAHTDTQLELERVSR